MHIKDKINVWFNPDVRIDADLERKARELLNHATNFAYALERLCPNGPDRNSALKLLRETTFFAVESLKGAH